MTSLSPQNGKRVGAERSACGVGAEVLCGVGVGGVGVCKWVWEWVWE